METFAFIISAILMGGFIYLVSQSFKTPHERTIQIITKFGKFHTAIMSVEGYRLNDPCHNNYLEKNHEAWDIIQVEKGYKQSWSEKWNIYFFLWPIFKTYVYSFSYTKLKKGGDIQPGDIVIWTDEKTSEIVISRTGVSDHIDFQVGYPTITGNMFTKDEMAKVLIFTNNVLMVTNPFKMLFRVNNWLGVVNETIAGALRGIIGKLTIQELNQVKSESGESDFTNSMSWINLGTSEEKDGIQELWGVKLAKSTFKAFMPADENTDALMDSFIKPKIAEQEGLASVTKATKEGEAKVATATATATAYSKEQEAIVLWKKRYLVDTGLAEVNDKGEITKLLPDANTRVSTEALKELAKLKGTLVINGDLQTMLNIKQGGAS